MSNYLGNVMRKGGGYTFNDDRSSGGRKTEDDIVVCSHCQQAMRLADWKSIQGWCGKCERHLCGPCHHAMLTGGCVPFIKYVEQFLENDYKSKQLARMLGI